jgi:hypothetical protein
MPFGPVNRDPNLESQISSLYLGGNSYLEIEKILKVGTHRISKIILKNNIYPRKGLQRKHTDEEKKKISNSLKGKKRSIEFCKRNSEIHKGRIRSLETRMKISEARTGKFIAENNPNWRGGVTSNNEKIRKSEQYNIWRYQIFNRDKYICQGCGQYGGKLHAHHIKSFSKYPDIRFELSNGVTLCEECHKKTNNYLNPSSNSERSSI